MVLLSGGTLEMNNVVQPRFGQREIHTPVFPKDMKEFFLSDGGRPRAPVSSIDPVKPHLFTHDDMLEEPSRAFIRFRLRKDILDPLTVRPHRLVKEAKEYVCHILHPCVSSSDREVIVWWRPVGGAHDPGTSASTS
jgi:hypothetical protein